MNREIMSKLGVRTIAELVGRSELITMSERLKQNPKWAGIDLSGMIQPAFELKGTVLNEKDVDNWLAENHKIMEQDHGLDAHVQEGEFNVED